MFDRDAELQLHNLYYSLRAPVREAAAMTPHPDEEQCNFSSQSLWGMLVSLLGFLAKSKPWKISSFDAVSHKSLFHPDPQKLHSDQSCLHLLSSSLSATHKAVFPCGPIIIIIKNYPCSCMWREFIKKMIEMEKEIKLRFLPEIER